MQNHKIAQAKTIGKAPVSARPRNTRTSKVFFHPGGGQEEGSKFTLVPICDLGTIWPDGLVKMSHQKTPVQSFWGTPRGALKPDIWESTRTLSVKSSPRSSKIKASAKHPKKPHDNREDRDSDHSTTKFYRPPNTTRLKTLENPFVFPMLTQSRNKKG
jgi:hypothetical protein